MKLRYLIIFTPELFPDHFNASQSMPIKKIKHFIHGTAPSQ